MVISLPENRSTGYRWMFDDEVNEVVPTPEPPPFASTPNPVLAASDVRAFLEAARSTRVGRTPGAALERARRHVPAVKTSEPEADRTLPGGIDVVGDDYLPGRTAALRGREARRARLELAAGPPRSQDSSEAPDQLLSIDESALNRTEPLIAATGRRLLGVRFTESGPKTLRLQHRSPYSGEAPAEQYVLHAIVEPRRRGFSIDQLVDDIEEPWTDEVRERRLRAPTTQPSGDNDANNAEPS